MSAYQLFISHKGAFAAGEAAACDPRRVLRFEVEPFTKLRRSGGADHGFRVSLWTPFGTFMGWV